MDVTCLEEGLEKIRRIKNNISNSKYLAAREEYLSLRCALDRLKDSKYRELYESLMFEFGKYDDEMQQMLVKCEDIDDALRSTSEPVEGTKWIFGSVCDGITTHYFLENDGTISLHVRGILTDVPLFEQLCVIYEIGLYSKWVPFCSQSHMLSQIGTLALPITFYLSNPPFSNIPISDIGYTEFLARVVMDTPFGISREVVVHAFGANCLNELDAIVIVTKSVEEFDGVDVPPVSGGFFSGRCYVKSMHAVTYLHSPTCAEVSPPLPPTPPSPSPPIRCHYYEVDTVVTLVVVS